MSDGAVPQHCGEPCCHDVTGKWKCQVCGTYDYDSYWQRRAEKAEAELAECRQRLTGAQEVIAQHGEAKAKLAEAAKKRNAKICFLLNAYKHVEAERDSLNGVAQPLMARLGVDYLGQVLPTVSDIIYERDKWKDDALELSIYIATLHDALKEIANNHDIDPRAEARHTLEGKP